MESPETIAIFDNDGAALRRPRSYVVSHIYPMGGFYSAATAVSDVLPGYPLAVTGSAQIYEPDYGGLNHASNGFLYDNGVMNNLSNPWGPNSPQGNTYPSDILPDRTIVGFAEQYGHTTAFHWSPTTRFTFLQPLSPDGWTRVSGINPNGRMVGTGRNVEGFTEVVRWENENSQPEALVFLAQTVGRTSSWGTAVNSAGEIVGYSQTDSGATHGFLLPSLSVKINLFQDDLGTVTSNARLFHLSQ